MKILVTGGAGFIGSHMVDYLLKEDHDVVVIDNLSLGRMSNIEHNTTNKGFSFYRLDLLDHKAVSDVFAKESFDVVFHLAANSDIARSHDDPDVDCDNTFHTTYAVLKMMKEHGVKNIVFASTSAIYGETGSKLTEDYGPLFPVSHYGASKMASEAFISSFSYNYDINTWITRFPNVVGERATHGVIFDFINKLRANPRELVVLGDGRQFKPYLYVKDLVEAILFIWKNAKDTLNYFNIGVDTRSRVSSIAEMVIQEMGLDAKISYTGGSRGWIGDVPEFNYNLDKIHKLGWKARLTSDESVRKAIRYILDKDK